MTHKILLQLSIFILSINSILGIDLNLQNGVLDVESLRSFKHVDSLDLHTKDIQEINEDAFSEMKNVNYLDLSGNEFVDLPERVFEPLGTHLEVLDIYSAHMTEIHPNIFQPLVNLKAIALVFEEYFNFHPQQLFRNTRNLGDLELIFNNEPKPGDQKFFNCDDLRHMHKLKAIELDRVGPKNLDNQFLENMKHLTDFSIRNSHIESIPEDLFIHNLRLELVDLSFNDITELNERTFRNSFKLKILNLSNNKIHGSLSKNIFRPLTGLRELLFRGNLIESLEENLFQRNRKLQVIDLKNNQLTNIPGATFHNLSALSSVTLSGNPCIDKKYKHQQLNQLQEDLKSCQ